MTSQSNALAEIALALAMAFFSIMVLALVSMGAAGSSKKDVTLPGETVSAGMDIRRSSTVSETASTSAKSVEIRRDEMVIYYQDKFYDSALNEVPRASLKSLPINYLAVDPATSTADAIVIRNKFSSQSLVVTTLNDAWLKILKEKSK